MAENSTGTCCSDRSLHVCESSTFVSTRAALRTRSLSAMQATAFVEVSLVLTRTRLTAQWPPVEPARILPVYKPTSTPTDNFRRPEFLALFADDHGGFDAVLCENVLEWLEDDELDFFVAAIDNKPGVSALWDNTYVSFRSYFASAIFKKFVRVRCRVQEMQRISDWSVKEPAALDPGKGKGDHVINKYAVEEAKQGAGEPPPSSGIFLRGLLR